MLTVGCATDLTYKKTEGKSGEKAIIASVPFISQKLDLCGPTSLAIVFNFWGITLSQDEIAREIYSLRLKGTLSLEMLLYATDRGFDAEMYNGNLQDIKDKIQHGFPLIVSHRENKDKKRVHYLVVFGFDDNKEIVYVHSGTKQNLKMDYNTFLKHWNWADNLTFFIRPN